MILQAGHTLDNQTQGSRSLRWPVRRPLVDGQVLPQGEVLDRKLAVTAAEAREQAKQVEQESDHRAGIV